MPDPFIHETEWYKFASQGTLGTTERCQNRSDSLQYFIVGNYTQGFLGIERDRSVPAWWNEHSQYCWAYKDMNEAVCRKVLSERVCNVK